MLGRFLVAAAMFGGMVVAAQAQTLTVDIKARGFTKADVEKAIEVFRQNCQPLGGKGWSDISKVEAEVSEEYAPHRTAKGWKTTVFLKLRLTNDPKIIPADDRDAGVIAGQTLHYAIGGGTSPGYFATKRSSQLLCGLPVNDRGGDEFKAVPAFSFLER